MATKDIYLLSYTIRIVSDGYTMYKKKSFSTAEAAGQFIHSYNERFTDRKCIHYNIEVISHDFDLANATPVANHTIVPNTPLHPNFVTEPVTTQITWVLCSFCGNLFPPEQIGYRERHPGGNIWCKPCTYNSATKTVLNKE